MASESEIRSKFWKSLKSDRTLMLGILGSENHAQPMTAQMEDDEGGPIWIFTSKDTDLVRQIGQGARGMVQFVSKGHDLFACFDGDLSLSTDRAVIDKLWSPFVAAWFEGGKDDPKLQLIRIDPGHAQIWLNENSLFSGVKLLLGKDPKQEYAGKTADTDLGGGSRPN